MIGCYALTMYQARRLVSVIARDLGLSVRVRRTAVSSHAKGGPVIVIPVETMRAVSSMIGKFVPPSMRYKIHADAPMYDPDQWDSGPSLPYWARVIVRPVTERFYRDQGTVYCLDVEDDHNFMTVGGVVHNCLPSDDGRRFRKPHNDEVTACTSKWTFPELRALSNLRVLVAVGGVAASALLGREVAITRERGRVFRSEFCSQVVPILHPSYLLRQNEDPELMRLVREDLKLVQSLIARPLQVVVDELDNQGPNTIPSVADAHSSVVEAAQWEQRIVQALPWHPGRKYVAGWSDERDVVLLYRDEAGERKTERVEGFPWYFLMRTDDALRVPVGLWREHAERGVFERLEADPVSDEWARIYAMRRIAQTAWLRERGEVGIGLDVLDEVNPRYPDRQANWTRFDAERRLHDFLVALHAHGWTYEADLTPRQRFMTDRYVEIDDRYNELYLDIETDDSVPDWQHKERWRHLAYALVLRERDGTESRQSYLLDREDDASERAMLHALVPWLDRADIVYAWNGKPFDFPLMRARFKYHGIAYDWRQVIWCDLIAVWRRYHSRSAVTSFALDVLAPKVLGAPKIDWRAESEKLGRRADRMIDLYRWHPGLCRRYNENDTELLYGLEQKFGYAAADRIVGRLGNTFASDPYVGSKVDALLLNRGAALGHHYVTRGLQLDALPPELAVRARAARKADDEAENSGERPDVTYAGAYVFPSVAGYHEGVAALDFKSLYPTTMMLFNISPETWVPASERSKYELADLTTTPSGATFRKRGDGVIPLVFREITEQRKVYTRVQLAEPVGSDAFKRYERIAGAYKTTGLSFYGALGNVQSRYYNPEVAEAVTLTGQWFERRTAELAESRGYRVVAGDTDSLHMPMTEVQARAFAAECGPYYRAIVAPFNVDMVRFGMELEFENYFATLLITTKKRYAGLMTMFKGKPADHVEVKGLECVRSDGLEFARKMQRRFLERILRGRRPPAGEITAMVEAERATVLSGTLTVDEVSMTQSVDKPLNDYKTTPPHVRVARYIRATTNEYYQTMKVPYVMVSGPVDPEKPWKKVTPVPVWAREYEGNYDRYHAWNDKIFPPTRRVLEVVYPVVDWGAYVVEAPKPPRPIKGKRGVLVVGSAVRRKVPVEEKIAGGAIRRKIPLSVG